MTLPFLLPEPYIATNNCDDICITIAPSPPGLSVFTHLAQNQFSNIDVTKSAAGKKMRTH